MWSDAGTDPAAIADRLDELAATATTVRFEPRALPDIDRALLHRAALFRARRQLALRHGEKDRILAEEVRAVDDLVRTANLMVERLREWYALHAPEVTRLADPKQLAALVAEHGDRASVLTALEQVDQAEDSLGTELEAADMAVVRGFAAALRAVHESWAALETRITQIMEEMAPNLSVVAGPVIGARLIAMAGTLQKLATVSTGTLQLYGAETALFRHLKEGTKPPKHGILFQHPKLHQAPPWQRGAIARTLAQHASLAAKADAFTGNDLKDFLTAGLEKDIKVIQYRKAKPPARPQGGRPGGKPGGKPFGKPGAKPYAKRGDSGGKAGGYGSRPAGKPSGGKPSGGFGPRGGDRPAGKSSWSGGGNASSDPPVDKRPAGGGWGGAGRSAPSTPPSTPSSTPRSDAGAQAPRPTGSGWSGGAGKPAVRSGWSGSGATGSPGSKPSGDSKPERKPDHKPSGKSDWSSKKSSGPGSKKKDKFSKGPAAPPGGRK